MEAIPQTYFSGGRREGKSLALQTFLLLLVLAGGMVAGCASTDCIKPQISRSNLKPLPQAEPEVSELEALVDSLALSYLAAGDLTDLSLAMAQAGELVLSQGYSEYNAERGIPIGPHTVFKIRSLTKQFTAALLLRLAEAEQVALEEDTLTFYWQDFPPQGHQGTLRQFLNPTSGLTHASSSPNQQSALAGGEKQWFQLDLSSGGRIKRFWNLPFAFAPTKSANTTTRGIICWAK